MKLRDTWHRLGVAVGPDHMQDCGWSVLEHFFKLGNPLSFSLYAKVTCSKKNYMVRNASRGSPRAPRGLVCAAAHGAGGVCMCPAHTFLSSSSCSCQHPWHLAWRRAKGEGQGQALAVAPLALDVIFSA